MILTQFVKNVLDESSCALTINGDLYVWGRNKDNLLGLGQDNYIINEPSRVILKMCLSHLVPYRSTQWS